MEYFNEDLNLSSNPLYNAPTFNTYGGNKKWYNYVDSDKTQYPDKLIYYRNNNSIHGAIVRSIARQIAGGGIEYDVSTDKSANTQLFLSNVNQYDENITEVISKAADDLYTFGGFALAIVYSKDYASITGVEHVNFAKVRASIVDEQGKIPGYYYSFNWSNNNGTSSQRPNTVFIPSFNQKMAKEKNNEYNKLKKDFDLDNNNLDKMKEFFSSPTTELMYVYPYSSGSFPYPLPDYVGGITSIQLGILTDQYGISSMENGLTVDYIVSFFGINDEKSRIKEAQSFLKQHANAAKRRRPIISFANTKEEAMTVENISGVNEDKTYTKINENSLQNILSAHSITSPLLVGVKTSGQLGGGQELKDAERIFYENVIKPKQNLISTWINKILRYNNMEEITIKKLNVFDTNNEIAK